MYDFTHTIIPLIGLVLFYLFSGVVVGLCLFGLFASIGCIYLGVRKWRGLPSFDFNNQPEWVK